MEYFKGKRIEKISELELMGIYIMDGELCQLVYIEPNRFVFQTDFGAEHINRAMLESRIKYGLFKVIE